jgi:hypothetical protein
MAYVQRFLPYLCLCTYEVRDLDFNRGFARIRPRARRACTVSAAKMLALLAGACGARSGVSIRMAAPGPARVVAIDFDGVLLDSEPLLTRTAWRASKERWPDVMLASAELDPRAAGARRAWVGGEWDELTGSSSDGLPNWLAAKMRKLRPVTAEPYESMLLMRLCVDEALSAARGARGERPLTPGEIQAKWVVAHRTPPATHIGPLNL